MQVCLLLMKPELFIFLYKLLSKYTQINYLNKIFGFYDVWCVFAATVMQNFVVQDDVGFSFAL